MKKEAVDEIFSLYEVFGNSDYIGEQVTQLEHALQCANLAEYDGYGDDVVLGAFLHDVGHLLGLKENKPDMKLNGVVFGTEDHENLGADYLRRLGVSENVCYLVRNHVLGKRYLVYKEKDYYDRLSEASKQTLKFQGGPMSESEAKDFEANQYFNAVIKMRLWDDLAKSTTLKLSQTYKERLEALKTSLLALK